jgi:hypothetical protein
LQGAAAQLALLTEIVGLTHAALAGTRIAGIEDATTVTFPLEEQLGQTEALLSDCAGSVRLQFILSYSRKSPFRHLN